jgi:hypothetical protein
VQPETVPTSRMIASRSGKVPTTFGAAADLADEPFVGTG